MKVIIAGGRDFNDYNLLKDKCDYYTANLKDIAVVSGRCHKGTLTFTTDEGVKVYGADGLGECWAKEKGFPVKPFPAEWRTHGKAAGPIRNGEMAHYGDYLIAFWDGKSRGTQDMINQAEREGLKVKIVRV